MTPQKDQKIEKEGRERFKKTIGWAFHYSGLKFIWQKFSPPKESGALPTGILWLIGIYVAFFGVASQRYENRIDIIENRANSIFAQLAVKSVQKMALSRIARVQNMTCPYKPNILNPHSVFISLFRDSKYKEMVDQLKETVEDWKDALDYVDLRKAILEKADLREARLEGADLRYANLRQAYLESAYLVRTSLWRADLKGAMLEGAKLERADLKEADLNGASLKGAKGLHAEQLCTAATLYMTRLDQELKAQIKEKCPELLEPAK